MPFLQHAALAAFFFRTCSLRARMQTFKGTVVSPRISVRQKCNSYGKHVDKSYTFGRFSCLPTTSIDRFCHHKDALAEVQGVLAIAWNITMAKKVHYYSPRRLCWLHQKREGGGIGVCHRGSFTTTRLEPEGASASATCKGTGFQYDMPFHEEGPGFVEIKELMGMQKRTAG